MIRFPSRLTAASVGVLLMAAISGCGTPPTIPTAVLMTEDFSGTVPKGGTDDRTFTVQFEFAPTKAWITLKSLVSSTTSAPLTDPIGLAFGQHNQADGTCTRFDRTNAPNARINEEYPTPDGFFPLPGTYCFAVYDSGSLTESANYVVSIRHY